MLERIISNIKKKYIYIIDFASLTCALISILLNDLGVNATPALLICVLSFALSLFIKNNYSKKQYDSLEEIRNSLNSRIQFNTIANTRENLNSEYLGMLKDCKELFISGSSLVRISSNIDEIMGKIPVDCILRIVLVKPDTEAANLMAIHIAGKDTDKYNKQIKKTIEDLKDYKSKHKCNRISVKLIDFCPPLGFVHC